MAASKLLNLIAITALALFASSLAPTPVNALSSRAQHLNRHVAHDAIAHKKRAASSKRCKPRPSSSLSAAPSSTPAKAAPASSKAPSPSPVTTHASSSPAPSPSPSPSKSAAPTPSNSGSSGSGSSGGSSGGSGGKVGLAWPNGGDSSLTNFVTSNVQSIYTWSPDCPSNTDGAQCWPMLWGWNQVDEWEKKVQSPSGNNNILLAINEPNESGQSNMSPQSGCQLWQQHVQPKAAKGFKLIAPATSSNPNGLKWVQDFMGCCTGCTFDGVAVHWYDIKAQDFITYLELWHNTFNLDVYVTEYAVQNFNGGAQASLGEIFAFHKTVGPYMNSQPWVKVYMPFGAMHDLQGVNPSNSLMKSDGSPTDLGWMIVNNAY